MNIETAVEPQHRVLLVDDEPEFRLFVTRTLEPVGYSVREADTVVGAMRALAMETFEAVVLDIYLGAGSGFDILRVLSLRNDYLPIIVVTAGDDGDLARQAISNGAHDFLKKPIDPDHLCNIMDKAIEHRELAIENRLLHRLIDLRNVPGELVAISPKMTALLEAVREVAQTDHHILLCGEAGSGKTLIAKQIHRVGVRPNDPFVSLNCRDMPSEALEDELLGHEWGASSRQMRSQPGLIEAAAGGTLFLENITELQPRTQKKLARVLETRQFRRTHSQQSRPTGARLVAATHKDPLGLTHASLLQTPLHEQLATAILKLPSLRDRPEDFAGLCNN
ncbi:MAG: sigma 54-interacting transcriptional regulator, partial [Acidobacteriota bacterium]|nr:sigma 54-interacting transcriptional regulator [Acidobacteriota bacterium]